MIEIVALPYALIAFVTLIWVTAHLFDQRYHWWGYPILIVIVLLIAILWPLYWLTEILAHE